MYFVMMRLQTISEKINRSMARVFWRVGIDRAGIIDVTLDNDSDESGLMAELAVLRYLLVDQQVFGVEPFSGVGITLEVSKGAIKKLARSKSTKIEASKFAAFLSMRMQGCEIKVSKDRTYMAAPDEESIEYLLAKNSIYGKTFESLSTPAIGEILITKHALEQYINRVESGQPRSAFKSLVKRLSHPSLVSFELPENVHRHKQLKYGRSDNVEVWGHESSDLFFIFVIENGQKILVTTVNSNRAKKEMTLVEQPVC